MQADVKKTLDSLHKEYPNLKYYLNYGNPVELVVGAILSAQVRDEVVNETTPVLFAKYKTAGDFAESDLKELAGMIKNITFAEDKAKHIKAACKIIVEQYDGKVPDDMDSLTELPGVGRKTANAILQNAFGIVEGIVVDTHVLRVSYRLGWTDTDKKADKSEEELVELLPMEEWKTLPWLMKAFGREICKAPVPICSKCLLNSVCPKKGVKTSE